MRPQCSIVVLVMLATCLSACVNLPYIEPTRRADQLGAKRSLDDAVAYADRSYDAYEAKIIEEWRRQQGLSTTLIGVGGVAIGAALGHAHRDVFAALGLGSALGYQLGTWNSNPKRIGIYLDGMKALVCAKAAVQPLRLGDDARTRIRTAQGHLHEAIKKAGAALEAAGPARIAPDDGAGAQALQTELQGLQVDLEEAWQVQKQASSVDQRIDGAAAVLEGKIDEIRRIIDEALDKTQADPASLRTAIQGISVYATQFIGDASASGLAIAGVLAPPKSDTSSTSGALESKRARPPELRATEASTGAALGAVSNARVQVKGAVSELKGTIDRPFDSVKADMGGCGVDTGKLETALSLEEATLQFKAGQVRHAVVMAKGGTRPLSVAALDSPTPGLTVSISPEGGSVIVAADTKTEAGSYRYKARDAAGQSATLTITVTGNGNAVPPGGTDDVAIGEKESGSKLCAGLGQLSHAKACFLQSKLQVPVDGKAGPVTCAAFKEAVGKRASTTVDGFELFARRSDLKADSTGQDYLGKMGARDEASCRAAEGKLKVHVKVEAPAAAQPVGADAKLSADQIRMLAGALGHEPVTDLNQLREALAANQRDGKCPSTGGVFTEAEVARLYRRQKCG